MIKLKLHSFLSFEYCTYRCLLLTEGQPESIVQDIENMVRSYIAKVIQKSFSLNFKIKLILIMIIHYSYALNVQVFVEKSYALA